MLDAVALLADHQRPWYAGAEIVTVREAPARRIDATEVTETRGVVRRAGIGQVLAVR